MDLFGLFDFGFLNELLSDSGKASLAEKLLIVGVVWASMGRRVAAHFKSLEKRMSEGFEQLTMSIGAVKDTLHDVELSHNTQLADLGQRVTRLEDAKPGE